MHVRICITHILRRRTYTSIFSLSLSLSLSLSHTHTHTQTHTLTHTHTLSLSLSLSLSRERERERERRIRKRMRRVGLDHCHEASPWHCYCVRVLRATTTASILMPIHSATSPSESSGMSSRMAALSPTDHSRGNGTEILLTNELSTLTESFL